MIIGKNIFAMLLIERFFKTFIKKGIANSKKTTEVLLAIQVDSKKRVDEMFTKAIKAGGKKTNKTIDHGWMYGRDFEDLDGHIWEVFYMDEKAMPKKH